MADNTLDTTCAVVGGGPAGVMLGYLLARSGVEVTVLEKHRDFFRDFRGDTVHPSTLDVLHELGLLDDFLKIPHQKVTSVGGRFGDFPFQAADVSRVPARCKFVALMPQWDFLNFLTRHARKFPAFELLMEHEAIGLMRDGARIGGVIARKANGETATIRARLVVGCDGRHSVTRQAAQLELQDFGVPIDVLWFRISRISGDPEQVFGTIDYGKMLILINRNDYFQAGMIVRKGSFDEIRQRGLDAFRAGIRQLAPWFDGRVDELQDWNQIKLLTVQINRLRRWYLPGLLCIGDAAHAMSPAGGVGINLAIQDAVAAANLLAGPLLRGTPTEQDLAAVQKRREFPARVTQAVQVVFHRQMTKVFDNPGPARAPWQLKAIQKIPGIHAALGYAIGIGVRPEHVNSAPREPIRWRAIAGLALAAALGIGVALIANRRRSRPRRLAVIS